MIDEKTRLINPPWKQYRDILIVTSCIVYPEKVVTIPVFLVHHKLYEVQNSHAALIAEPRSIKDNFQRVLVFCNLQHFIFQF